MADRDTTSTPFKLSADGLTYFRYPGGNAPVVQVADYAELRTKGQADAGERSRITVMSQYIAGAFEWSATDPYALGDDGGLVIAATDGWWVRKFVPGEVLLDWWANQENQDYTALIQRIADTPEISTIVGLSLSVPQAYAVGLLDRVNIPHAIFHLKNMPGNEFTFKQTVASTLTEWRQWFFTGVVSCITDSGITLEGRKDLNAVNRTGDQKGLFDVEYLQDANVVLRHNTNWPICGAIVFRGNNRNPTTEIYGIHNGGGIEHQGITYGGPLHIEAEINDPECLSMGVDQANPPNTIATLYKGITLNPIPYTKITGKLTSHYGMMCYGGTGGLQDGMGNSASDPFVIEKIDGGYMGDGTHVDAFGSLYLQGILKNDGILNGENPCYMKIIYSGKFSGENLFFIETTPDSPGETKTHNHQYIEVVNNTTEMYTYRGVGNAIESEAAPPVSCFQRDNYYTGYWTGLSCVDGPTTYENVIIDGTDSGALYTNSSFSAGALQDDVLVPWAGPCLATNVHFTAKGLSNKRPVILASAGGDVVITNLTVESQLAIPDFMHIGSIDSSFPISVDLVNHSLPSGTTIKAVDGAINAVVFKVNGVAQSLPYTVP